MRALRERLFRGLKIVLALLVALVLGRRAGSEAPEPPEPESPTREREVGAQPRATGAVAALLFAAAAAFVVFVALYAVDPDTQLLGICLGLGAVAVGVALALAGKAVVPQEQAETDYEDFGDPAERHELKVTLHGGGEGISRRGLLLAAGGAAALAGGAAALAPLASLGPRPGRKLFATPWSVGRTVVGTDYSPLRAADVREAMMLTGFPEGADRDSFGAPLIIVRLPVAELELDPEQLAGAPEGILAFSRICPHAGCAVSIYRHPQFDPSEPGPALVCPCHYSTFDPRRGGALEFGPAGRDLPQLPLQINAVGELEAAGDFFEPVGPSYGGVRQSDPGASQQ